MKIIITGTKGEPVALAANLLYELLSRDYAVSLREEDAVADDGDIEIRVVRDDD